MSCETLIAAIRNNALSDCRETLLPLYLKRTGDLNGWLVSRAIDKRRTNYRLLIKALRLHSSDAAEIVLSVNAAKIEDRYWVKPEGFELCSEACICSSRSTGRRLELLIILNVKAL
jgi:hypothetical protein